MTEIVSSVEVNAAPARVWQVLTDFRNYRDWHPYIELDGIAEEGTQVAYAIRRTPKSSRLIRSEATITRLEPALHLRFKLGITGLTWMEEWYALESAGNGTLLTHGVEFRGLLSFIGTLSRARLTPYFRLPIASLARRFAQTTAKQPEPAKPRPKAGQRPPNVRRRRR